MGPRSSTSKCNHHGRPSTDTGYDCTCKCDNFWGGVNCDSCELDCNQDAGHGTENGACSSCNCVAPWTGTNCEICESPDNEICSYHGYIDNTNGQCDSCICDN